MTTSGADIRNSVAVTCSDGAIRSIDFDSLSTVEIYLTLQVIDGPVSPQLKIKSPVINMHQQLVDRRPTVRVDQERTTSGTVTE